MSEDSKKLPLLWFLTGTIGDALMALALCREIAELNPGVKSVMFVRRDPTLVKDLAKLVPSVRVESARFTPLFVWHVLTMLSHPWQIVSAWKSVGMRKVLRGLFLLNPRTHIARFDFHESATERDMVAPYDMQKLVIDNFRVLAQKVGLKTLPLGSPSSLPINAVMPKSFDLIKNSYIVLHPLGSNDIKSLPLERARELLNALAVAYPAFSFVVTGGASDAPVIDQMIEGVPRAQAAINLPILEVAGLIQNASLYIGVDTGITHLAAMMGKEMLALEHPTFPRWYPTYNRKAVMLLDGSADARAGEWELSDDEIVSEVTKLLA